MNLHTKTENDGGDEKLAAAKSATAQIIGLREQIKDLQAEELINRRLSDEILNQATQASQDSRESMVSSLENHEQNVNQVAATGIDANDNASFAGWFQSYVRQKVHENVILYLERRGGTDTNQTK